VGVVDGFTVDSSVGDNEGESVGLVSSVGDIVVVGLSSVGDIVVGLWVGSKVGCGDV